MELSKYHISLIVLSFFVQGVGKVYVRVWMNEVPHRHVSKYLDERV